MKKILIVDDEPMVAASLRRLFRRRGFEVLVASSGSAALGALEAFGPDVVLSDYMMPGMNGVQLLVEVARLAPQARRILLTGHADVDPASLGTIILLAKPWDDDQLLAACQSSA